MTAKVICMASSKGGSGKTVLTTTFATFLVSALNKEVLLIDTDAATNGLTLMHLQEVMAQAKLAKNQGRVPCGIYNLMNEVSEAEIVCLTNGVHLLPATYSFINTETIEANDYYLSLKSALECFRPHYDYIFLDAQAGSDVYAQIAMSADISDEVVIVSEYDPMSAAGVERLKGLFHKDLTPMRTWMLLNKMLPDFVRSFSDFLEVARYLSPIHWDADVVRAYARRKTALNLDVGNEYTLAVMKTLRTLLGEEVALEINNWANNRANIFRQPIEEQYEKMEQELKNIFIERKKIELSKVKFEFISIVVMILILITATFFFIPLNQDGHLSVSKLFSIVPSIIGIAVISTLFISSLLKTKILKSRSEENTNELRNRRREAYLEEKLRKLEALKDADFETIVKTNSKSD